MISTGERMESSNSRINVEEEINETKSVMWEDFDLYTKKSYKEAFDNVIEPYRNTVMGMYLNGTVYYRYLLYMELLKYGSKVDKKVLDSDRVGKDIQDVSGTNVWLEGSHSDHSLKEMWKREAWFHLVCRYVYNIKNKKVYPSEVKRKEASLKNKFLRIEGYLDKYFERDIKLGEIDDVCTMMEIALDDDGGVNVHGTGCFNFKVGDFPFSRLEDVIKEEKELEAEGRSIIDGINNKVNEMKKVLRSVGINSSYGEVSKYYARDYAVGDMTEDSHNIEEGLYTSLMETGEYLKDVREDGEMFFVNSHSFSYGGWRTNVGRVKEDVEGIKEEIKEFKKVRGFYEGLRDRLNQMKGMIVSAEDDHIVVNVRRIGNYNNTHTQEERMFFYFREGVLYRETGEPVYTIDAIEYEANEIARGLSGKYIETIDRARDMLVSSFSKEEEEMFEEEGIAILDGGSFYYGILDGKRFNSVVKIPKDVRNKKDIKSLCIHPKDSRVPLYDGLSAISFALKTGNEEYVWENSNEMGVSERVVNKCMGLISRIKDNEWEERMI